MDADTLARIAASAQSDVQRIGDSTLEQYLRPVAERALLLKAMEMAPEDHLAIEAAKGPEEHQRFMQEVERVRGKYGNVGG